MNQIRVRDFAGEVREMTEAGHSTAEIAKVIGVRRGAISRFQTSLGLRPKRGDPIEPYREKIQAMIGEGLSLRRISARLGIKYDSLRTYTSRNGIRAARDNRRKIELRIDTELYAAIEQRAGHRPVENVVIDLLAAAVKA